MGCLRGQFGSRRRRGRRRGSGFLLGGEFVKEAEGVVGEVFLEGKEKIVGVEAAALFHGDEGEILGSSMAEDAVGGFAVHFVEEPLGFFDMPFLKSSFRLNHELPVGVVSVAFAGMAAFAPSVKTLKGEEKEKSADEKACMIKK